MVPGSPKNHLPLKSQKKNHGIYHLNHPNLHDFGEKQFQPFHLTTYTGNQPPKKKTQGGLMVGDPYNSPI